MLFNVNTIGSCFLTDQWYIETAGQFAGACIATFILVACLEFLRRSAREYDRFIVRQHLQQFQSSTNTSAKTTGSVGSGEAGVGNTCAVPPLRPSVLQQTIRAFLHMLQFSLAYIVML